MSAVYPLLARFGMGVELSFLSSADVDYSIAPDPEPVFRIGRDIPSLPVVTSHALFTRRSGIVTDFATYVGHSRDVFSNKLAGGLRVSGIDETDGAPPSRSSGQYSGVAVFREGDTIASFISDKPQQIFYLGINPETGFLEAHDSTIDRMPEYCRVKLETHKVGQRPAFYFWDLESVSETDGWVPFRMKRWDIAKHAKHNAAYIIKSLFSFTLSVMAGRKSTVTDVRLPKEYRGRVGVFYDIYCDYLKAGCLPYFQEMLRLGEWKDGRLQPFIASETDTGRRYEENLADFAERIAVTMGLDRFILSISADGTLTAIQDAASAPPCDAWNFLLTQVAPGAFTVARQTTAGKWETLNPRVYDNTPDIIPILVGPESKQDDQSRLGLSPAEINTLERRNQVSLLLTLAARGADFANLHEIIVSGPVSVNDRVEKLFEFSLAHPHYMDFLSRVPNLNEEQPEIRFLTAVDQIFTALFARLLHQPTGTVLGTYGHYYLRYALRIYVVERVRRDFASFLPQDRTVAAILNLFSDELLGLRGRIATPRTVQRELADIPIQEFMVLAAAYQDQDRFIAGTPAREKFTERAIEIAKRALYPTVPDEPLN